MEFRDDRRPVLIAHAMVRWQVPGLPQTTAGLPVLRELKPQPGFRSSARQWERTKLLALAPQNRMVAHLAYRPRRSRRYVNVSPQRGR